jgi:hypothetical protein
MAEREIRCLAGLWLFLIDVHAQLFRQALDVRHSSPAVTHEMIALLQRIQLQLGFRSLIFVLDYRWGTPSRCASSKHPGGMDMGNVTFPATAGVTVSNAKALSTNEIATLLLANTNELSFVRFRMTRFLGVPSAHLAVGGRRLRWAKHLRRIQASPSLPAPPRRRAEIISRILKPMIIPSSMSPALLAAMMTQSPCISP